MEEVQQQLMLPTIRSYLKLYTTMPLDKMAGFMEMPVEEFRNHLLAFKHKVTLKRKVFCCFTSYMLFR